MAPAELVLAHVERLLASAGFRRNERMSRFLRYIVDRQLAGSAGALKELVIGVEVFGRKPGYDPQRDPIVRTEAARLRTRLARYYEGEGKCDAIVIELPKGGYAPQFRLIQEARTANADSRVVPRRRWLLPAFAGVFIVLIAVGGWRWHLTLVPIRIAVLPFVDLSQNPADGYLTDGITIEIIRNLSLLEGVAVRSETSSFAFKGKPRNIREAGRQLDVDYAVEGTLERAGSQLRINAQFVRVRDDFPLWSKKYDQEAKDIFGIEDEVSRGVVNSLRLTLNRGRRRYETSVEAADLYMEARATAVSSFPGDLKVIDGFERVIAKDPSFAPAYAGLAAAHAYRSFSGVKAPEAVDESDRMRTAADKAIDLDPLLPEAFWAKGVAYARNGQWKEAEFSFRHAIKLGPSLSAAHGMLARFVLWPLGRISEAVREMRIAEENDPLSPQSHFDLADVLLTAGRFSEAERQCVQIPTTVEYRNECLGRTWLFEGKNAEAIRLLTDLPTQNWGYLAFAYGKAGMRSEAEKLMNEAPTRYPDHKGAFQFALAFAGLGDKDQAIERLTRFSRVGPVRIGFTLNSPEFFSLRGDVRVKALRVKVGLPQ